MSSTIQNIPSTWGKDSISEFIETAQHNTIATFVNLPHEYENLKNINDIYWKVIDNLLNTPEWFASFFLLKAHSSYLGGVRLSVSGQCAETYMLLRGCLEAALYGLYLSRNEKSQEVWLRRHDDEKSLKRVREEFAIGKLLRFLESVDTKIHKTAKLLYERTIDFGAHPNELALTSLLRKSEDKDNIKFDLQYLSKYTPSFHLTMKTTVQVGLCALYIFGNIYRERFMILGIDKELDKLKTGL